MDDIITLDYGSGGTKTSSLIEQLIVPAMNNSMLSQLSDGAIANGSGQIAFSTDSFVIDPIFFPGGDIGKLSVCGTVNDVLMCGAEPKYLSLAFIIEEGLETESLQRIISSVSETAKRAGVSVITGDTKVVDRGRGDKIYINTSGIGFVKHPDLGKDKIRPGDVVILSGTAGDHGAAIMMARTGMMSGSLQSDCAPLNKLCETVLQHNGIKIMRDPTRGGVATTLNEFVEGTSLCIELDENSIPVRPEVTAVCDMLGLDPLYCANEGKLLVITDASEAEALLADMRKTENGENAAIIGTVSQRWPGRVVMKTEAGGSRILQKLSGSQLPRIC